MVDYFQKGGWCEDKYLFIIVLIPFLSSIYFGFMDPLIYDEAYTYLNFTRDSFYVCLVVYPFPNNHVLYSFITSVIDSIPFVPAIVALRLPVIIVGLFSLCFAYFFLKRFYSRNIAVFIVGIASLLPMSILYTYQARGYGILMLFFLIAFYAVHGIISSGAHKYWLLFLISSVLGLYTIPSFLYPLLILNFLILIFKVRDMKKLIICNLLILVFTVFLYLPIILNEGLSALISNPFVKSIDREEVLQRLPSFMEMLVEDIFHLPPIVVGSLLLVAFLYNLLIARDQNKTVVWLVFLITPIVLLIVQSVIPFSRTFVYYGFVLVFLFGISFRKSIDVIPLKVLVVLVLFAQVVSFVSYGDEVLERKKENDDFLNFVLKDSNKTYCIGTPGVPTLEYEMLMKWQSINTHIEYNAISADTIYNYDYIIMYRSNDKTSNRKPDYQDRTFNVYVND